MSTMTENEKAPTQRTGRAGAVRTFEKPQYIPSGKAVQDASGPRAIGDLFPGIVFHAGLRSINSHIARGDIEEARKLVTAMGMTWDSLFNRRAA